LKIRCCMHSWFLMKGGQYILANAQIKNVASYVAKMDMIYVTPSYWPPADAMKILTIQPLSSFNEIGIPVTFYRWWLELGKMKDKGIFFWIGNQGMYGTYSRQDPGSFAEDIVEWAIQRTGDFMSAYGRGGRKQSIQALEGAREELESQLLRDSLGSFAASVDKLSAIPVGKSKR